MSRVTDYDESIDFTKVIAKYRSIMDSLKLSPQIVGPSNLVIKETTNDNTWDINGSSHAPFQQRKFRVTFTYDQAVAPFSELLLATNVTGVASADFQFAQYDDPENANLDTKKSWIVYTTNWDFSNNASFFLKAYVRSPDTGTITVEEV